MKSIMHTRVNCPIARGRSSRRFLPLLSILLMVGITATVSRAQMQFDVFLGYDGVVPEAQWFPVVCEIKNDGPAFTAVIELTQSYQKSDQAYRAVVELPTGTLKRVVIPVFSASAYSGAWNAELLNERGRRVAWQENLPPPPRRAPGWEVPLMASLSRTVAGTPKVEAVKIKQADLQSFCARLQPSIFPDNAIALEGLDALYLNAERATALSAGQSAALMAWLHAGGHLIVGVEQISDVSGVDWLRQLFPCELTGMTTVSGHPELQRWIESDSALLSGFSVSRVESHEFKSPFNDATDDPAFEQAELLIADIRLLDGKVVAGAPGRPYIVTASRGHGRLTALLFSPEREPFRSWENAPKFWARMLNVPARFYLQEEQSTHQWGMSLDGVFGAMIDSRQVRKLPVHWLLLLLVAYLVVIGPLDRYWLRKMKKEMLTWLTFPAYVAIFSCLIYLIGYRLRAGETEWNELHVVDVLARGERVELRGRTYASVYSPVNAQYQLAGNQTVATLRGEFLGGYGGGQQGSRVDVYQSGNQFQAEINVPVWTSQLYVSDWWNPAPRPLTATVSARAGGYSVKLENGLDTKLRQARLVVAGQVLELGDLEPKETKTLSVAASGVSLGDFVRNHGSRFQQVVQQRQYAFGGSQDAWLHDAPNAAMAASFISRLGNQPEFIVPPGLDLSPLVERGDAVLLAWTGDYSPVESMRQFDTKLSQRNTLWRMAVPVQ